MNLNTQFPQLGFGLGLRPKHYPHIFEHWPEVDWFEIISENYMDTDGRPKRNLARIKERYPVVMHGVSLSIGTVDPLNSDYLKKLKNLIDEVQPAWISDHLCWTGIAHKNAHDLLPVPYTEEALKHIVARIKQVQDYLERPIALENPSTYLEFKTSHIAEAEFITRMAEESGCQLLLDVNNVYVTCYNHRLDPKAYLDALPLDKVIQIHLSGHTNKGTHIIDTHDDHVIDDVWTLYQYVVNKAGRTPNTMVEWDASIPEFEVLYAELNKAKQAAKDAANHGQLPDLAHEQVPQKVNHQVPLVEEETRMMDAILQGEKLDSDPQQWIRIKEEFSAQAQLDVYINAYRYRLYDVVAEDYPVLRHYLGEEAFKSLIWAFVENVHSTHFNVARYAAQLPDFIAQHIPSDPFANELCQLETALVQLADEKETTALALEDIQGLTPDELMEIVLHLRKALALMAFRYPVNDYFGEVKKKQSPESPDENESWVAVMRHDDRMWRIDLDELEYQMLHELQQGKTVGDALAVLQNDHAADEAELLKHISQWFARWMRHHLLAQPNNFMEADMPMAQTAVNN